MYLCLLLGARFFKLSDNLSTTLQKPGISASEAQELACITVKALQKLRDQFENLWTEFCSAAAENGVVIPDEPPRRRRVPARYEVGIAEPEFPETIEDHYRRIYFEVLDNVVTTIESRFEQKDYQMYANCESILLKAANGVDPDDIKELNMVTDFYGDDLDKQILSTQLVLFSLLVGATVEKTFPGILTFVKSLPSCQRLLISQVIRLMELIVIAPATNASSERSFSSLRRIKSYLRSTMTQERLNHVMVINVHKERTDAISSIDIAKDFISQSAHRTSIFGSFD